MSRAKLRVAATTRLQFDFLRLAVHLLDETVNLRQYPGMSFTISELVRSSATMSPR